MRSNTLFAAVAAAAACASASSSLSISDICDSSYVSASLPIDPAPGVVIDNSSLITAVATYTSGTTNYTYCNVTFSYTHTGVDDTVLVNYFLPDPAQFQNRYVSTGGGGYAINSGSTAPAVGLPYGAVGGRTDGGFGGFDNDYDVDGVDLLANGTLNYQALFLFGYQAHRELSLVGKALTKNVYSMNNGTSSTNGTKLYAYYSGCSEGGREGWSQVQRYGDEWDGAVIGAPAFRYAHQQVNHIFSAVVEQTVGYVPSPCEFETIVNATIAACDPLDGRTDGVVSRSDLCQLYFNISSLLGTSYSCPATTASSISAGGLSFDSAATPAQNGTFTAQSIEVAQTILDGLYDSDGKRAYIPWRPAASFEDATPTEYDNTTDTWAIPSPSLGSVFVLRLLELQEADDFASLDGITYDTVRDWMHQGWQKYDNVLQTTWPDLSTFHNAGGKIISYHGEADNSVPTASSVHYYDSVAKIMYPDQSFNESHDALGDWYRLFIVPGAAHCASNTLQPNGPYPETPLTDLIAWVEDGIKPVTLNSTVTQGPYVGDQPLCAWPLRPYWNNDTSMACEYSQESIATWQYTFDAFKMPVY